MAFSDKRFSQHVHRSAYPTYQNLLVRDTKGYTYVQPGQARTSPLIWRVMGRNTSRPWDKTKPSADSSIGRMPPPGSDALTRIEKQILIEWIDLGAAWDGIPEAEPDK